jgi:hypothetical protein
MREAEERKEQDDEKLEKGDLAGAVCRDVMHRAFDKGLSG